MNTINKTILLLATGIVAVPVGNFTATNMILTTPVTLSRVERVATNPFTFEPILNSSLQPNVPQGDDKDQKKDSDSSETRQPVIDSGTLT